MRTIRFLLEKEFRQIFRDKFLLRAIFIAPLIQLLILPWAANFEVKNILLAVVNQDNSSYSQKLISKISSSRYFGLVGTYTSYEEAIKTIEQDKADLVLEIPSHFERNLVRNKEQKLLIAINAINGVKAGLGGVYLSSIIKDFNSDVLVEWMQPGKLSSLPIIEITSSNWFNPMMNYQIFMVPGILVMLVTMIGGIMCSLNIVKEKEIGTIEQINVSPIRKLYFILGKLIPFWIIGMVVFTIGLIIARFVYGIVPVGSIGILYLFLAVYLLTVLGLGLLISTYSDTQQQAVSISFFFIMIFNMMSGLFTPIESMPAWAQVIASLNPLTYFIDVMRMVVLKGSGLADVKYHFAAIFAFALLFNFWAIANYKKII